MKKFGYLIVLAFLLQISFSSKVFAQLPSPALVGYWHNWNIAGAPYIPLDQVDGRYNVIDVSFAVPASGTDYKMEFNPVIVSQATLINQIQSQQNQGKKVIISIGGATAPVHLDNIAERDTFITTMTNIINTYGFDGIDIDLEGSSLSVSGGTISAPTDVKIINLIYATKKIMENYHLANNKKLLLTMAPETAFVQGGMSAYGGIWGAYLPLIDAMRDSIDMLHVQLYNSGSMYGIDNNIYTQSTADFIVAMVEAVIVGFNTSGGSFTGLPAHKVGVGLPACSSAAGGGYTDTNQVIAAVQYLRGLGPKPGSYTLSNTGGYSNLGGMMTWSINWDAAASCNGPYQYANTFQTLFTPTALSIVFDYFTVSGTSGSNNLQWGIREAVNSLGSFQVERSEDGTNFYNLGLIKITNPFQQSFSFQDDSPLGGESYYRIHYVDADGSSLYSFVRKMSGSRQMPTTMVYPNPSNGIFYIMDGFRENDEYVLFDIQGRKLKDFRAMKYGRGFDISEFPNGSYYLKLKSRKEFIKVFKK